MRAVRVLCAWALCLAWATAGVIVAAQSEGGLRLVTLLGDTAPAVSFAGSATQVATSSRGRLEIYHNGLWGTVCDDSFGQASRNVACWQLGWSTRAGPAGKNFSPINVYPTTSQQVTGQIWLDDVICTGSELTLDSCPHLAYGSHNCNHGEDQAIDCFSTNPTVVMGSRSIVMTSSVGSVAQAAGGSVTLTLTADQAVTTSSLRVAVTCVIGSSSTAYTATIAIAATTTTLSVAVPSSYDDSSMSCTSRYSSGDTRFRSMPSRSVTINVILIVGVSAVTRTSDTIPTPWTARSYAAATNYGTSTFIVAGGLAADGMTPLNDVWMFSGSTWTSFGTAAWSPRSRHAIVSNAGSNPFMVFSGRNANFTTVSDVWVTTYIPGNSWTHASESIFAGAREGAVAVSWRSLIFLVGGSPNTGASSAYNTIISMSAYGAQLTQYPTAPWVGRQNHGAVVMNDQLYVFGGKNFLGLPLNDVWRLSDPAGSWTQLSAMSCSPRHSFSYGVASTGLAVVGGTDVSGNMLSNACFFDGDHTWSAVKALTFTVSGASGVMPAINGRLYLMGGSTTASITTSDMWSLQMDPGFFEHSRVANAPATPSSSSTDSSSLIPILVPIGVGLILFILLIKGAQQRKRDNRQRAQNAAAAERNRNAAAAQQREGTQMMQMHSPPPGGVSPAPVYSSSPYAQGPQVPVNPSVSPVMVYAGNANTASGGAAAPEALFAPPVQYASVAPVATPYDHMQPGSPSINSPYAAPVPYAAPAPYAATGFAPAPVSPPVAPVLPAHVASDSKNRVHAELFTILDSLSTVALNADQQSRVQALVAHVHFVINELLSMPRAVGLEFAPMLGGGFGADPATPGPTAVQRIDAGSPAARLENQIQLNDQLVAIEGVPVQSAAHASFLLHKSLLVLPGQTADLSLTRLSNGYPTAVRAQLTVEGASNVPPIEVTNRMAALAADIAAARQLQAECGIQAR